MSPTDPSESLTTAARRALTDPAGAIDSLPWLVASIAADRDVNAFAAWGSSTVVDENTGAPVLDEALFDELHRRAGIAASFPVGNAGLLHCYGYLLSLAETPYGLKRDRWLTSDLARACGRPDDFLTPWTGATTLLARAASLIDGAFASAPNPRLVITTDAGVVTEIAATTSGGTAAVHYRVDGLLITAFPVGADATTTLATASAEPPRLRWNAMA